MRGAVIIPADISSKVRTENCPWTLATERSLDAHRSFLKLVMRMEDRME